MHEPKSRGSHRAVLVFLSGLAVVSAILVLALAHLRREAVLREAREDLLGEAALKAEAVADWRAERLGDGAIIRDNAFLVEGLLEYVQDPADPVLAGRTDAWFRGMEAYFGYANVLLLDGRGRLVRSSRPGLPLAPPPREALADTLDFLDLVPGSDACRLEVTVPLRHSGEDRPSGWVVLRVDPDRFLVPYLEQVSEPSRTGEVLLVRAKGDSVLFLTPHRHDPTREADFSIPADRRDFPAAEAVRGFRGGMEGRGYRGVRVLAAAAPVSGSPWTVVHQIDRAEVLGPPTREAWGMGVVAAVLVAVVGVIVLGYARRREGEFERDLKRQALRHTALTQHYQLLSRHANDVIVLADEAGRILDINERGEEVYGYSRDELLAMNVRDLRPPEHRSGIDEVMRGLEETGHLRLETLHRHRSGASIPVEINAALVKVGGHRYLQGVVRDMTEWVRVREELAESEALLHAAVDQLPGACVLFDHDLRVLYGNFFANRAAGLEVAEGRGKRIEEFLPPPVYEGFKDLLEACRDSGERQSAEREVALPAGTLQLAISMIPLAGPRGPATRILAYAYDLTERKAAFDALRISESRMRSLIEGVGSAILFLSPEGKILEFNPEAERIHGTPRTRALGENFVDTFVAREFRTEAREAMAQVVAGTPAEARTYEMITASGGTRPVRWILTPLRSAGGPVSGVIAAGTDQSERRELENQLEKLARAVEHSPISILITDADGVIEYVNPRFCETSGYARPEVVGSNPRILKSGRQPESFYREMWEVISSGREWRGEIVNRRKNGDVFVERAAIAPVTGPDGRITHYVGLKEDVTEVRKLEAQFRQSQKMEAVGRLAGGVAHDFNNLLTAISGFTNLALRGMPEKEPRRRHLEEVLRAADRAGNVTRQLLAFSRKQIHQPRVIDLNEILTEMTAMIRRLIGEDVKLTTSAAPDLGRVKADPGQIEQVMLNLIVNARDAMPEGGALTIHTDNVELDDAFVREHPGSAAGPHVVLAVRDSGCGMDPETLSHVFEPFFTTKKADKGTGLGLATVYGIVKQSSGYVDVESAPGQGTLFRIFLPRVEAAAEERSAAPFRSEWKRGRETVLLVEDNDGVRELLGQVLASVGYTVLTAENGDRALEVAEDRSRPIDLLLTDVVMPGMNGRDLARRLVVGRHDCRVLYMSGYTADAIVRYGVLDKDLAFIQKPFVPSELVAKVRAVLDAPADSVAV